MVPDESGPYPAVALSNIRRGQGRHTHVRVHELVATAFLGARPAGHEVNHKNGVKTDNRASNLEWTTRSGNMRHATDVLGHHRGSRNGVALLSEAQVSEILHARMQGITLRVLAERYGVTRACVTLICSRAHWGHVSAPNGYDPIAAKANSFKGAANGRAQLRDDDVREIRRLRAAGVSRPKIAASYSVSTQTIARIDRRENWAHVA